MTTTRGAVSRISPSAASSWGAVSMSSSPATANTATPDSGLLVDRFNDSCDVTGFDLRDAAPRGRDGALADRDVGHGCGLNRGGAAGSPGSPPRPDHHAPTLLCARLCSRAVFPAPRRRVSV